MVTIKERTGLRNPFGTTSVRAEDRTNLRRKQINVLDSPRFIARMAATTKVDSSLQPYKADRSDRLYKAKEGKTSNCVLLKTTLLGG